MAQQRFELEEEEIELFLADVNECLREMETGIVHLERGAPAEALHATFRAAHTLKSLAGMVGHQRMAELTHALETLFGFLREGRVQPTPELTDDLLTTVDALKALRDEVLNPHSSAQEVGTLAERLAAWVRDEPTPNDTSAPSSLMLSEEQKVRLSVCQARGDLVWEITVQVEPSGFAPGARLYQAMLALGEVGEIIAQSPSAEALSDQDRSLLLLIATLHDVQVITQRLEAIAELTPALIRHYFREPAIPFHDSEGEGEARRGSEKTVRIGVERLDVLMDLVGELVTDRTRLVEQSRQLRVQHGQGSTVGLLGETVAHLGRVIDQLQGEVMRARMLPIATLFEKVPRLVRDIARGMGKQVQLEMAGESTELDRSVIEAIADPLRHLLRNAVDHGLEGPEERVAAGKDAQGRLWLRAMPLEGQIVVTVVDDGRGIDPTRVRQTAVRQGLLSEERAAQMEEGELLHLLFLPGFSTREAVTELSGRGVGLDVVRTSIERLSGSVVVESQVGVGTTFRLTLPLTLAIVQTMLIEVAGGMYALPLAVVQQSLALGETVQETVRGKAVIPWGEGVLPLVDLRMLFGTGVNGRGAVIVVRWGKLEVGLVVDRIVGQQESVVKPLSPLLGRVAGLSGSAILGDGRIALMVDISTLLDRVLTQGQSSKEQRAWMDN